MKRIGRIENLAILFMVGMVGSVILANMAEATVVPVEEWNRTYGGSGTDVIRSVQQDLDGGFVSAGSTTSYGASGDDVWVIKTDINGTILWNKTFGGNGRDIAYCIVRTSDGGYALAGSIGISVSGAWVIKIDSSGNESWNKTFAGEGFRSIQQTLDGGYILAGSTRSLSYISRAWLVKIDSTGNESWNKTFGTNYGFLSSVQQTLDRGYILAGDIISTGSNTPSGWLIKTNENGTALWSKVFRDILSANIYSVQQTSDNGFVVAGRTGSYESGVAYVKGWLIKTNSSGNEEWNKTYGGKGYHDIQSVKQDLDAGYIFAGIANSYDGRGNNGWLTKTNSIGNEEWNTTFGGISDQVAFSFQPMLEGGYILAGYNVTYGTGDIDGWLVKVSNETSPLNQPPVRPDLLKQYKSDIDEIDTRSVINQRIAIFIAAVNDPDNEQVKLQIELRRLDEYGGNFDENQPGLKESDFVPSGNGAIVAVNDLANGEYHWRARGIDVNGNKGPWQEFGGNPTSAADFMVYPEFKFAHVTDTHLGYYVDPSGYLENTAGMEKSVTDFTDILQDIKGKNIDFIAVTGDLVQHREPEFFMAFRNLVREFDIKTTPGNHDRRWLVWLNDLTNYKNIVNPLNPAKAGEVDWSFSRNGYNFIGLDSGADYSVAPIPECNAILYDCITNAIEEATKSTPESDGLTETQWSKLTAGEFSQGSQRQVIFMHSPVMDTDDDAYFGDQVPPIPPNGSGGNNNAIANHRADLINYAINNRVDLVLTGHTHRDEVFDISGSSVGSVSTNRPLFIQTKNNVYRIIDVKDGKATPSDPVTPQLQEINDRKSSSASFSHVDSSGLSAQYGLHAYDSQKRHTGMIACNDDFELGIPNSYYTGNYLGISSKPEVLVGYSPDIDIKARITEFRIFSTICIPNRLSTTSTVNLAGPTMNTAVSEPSVATSAQSPENITFNQTVTDRTDESTTQASFYNVAFGSNSTATVNVSDPTIYKMEVDMTSDGIVDRVVLPSSISVTSEQPQSNISIIMYNGAGVIGLNVSAGNFLTAASVNESLIPEKQENKFPYGLVRFEIDNLINGSIINVGIDLPQNIPTNTQYWKYGRTLDNNVSHWYQISFGSNDGDNKITIQLQDGGLGDNDLTINGKITDDGGPVLSAYNFSGFLQPINADGSSVFKLKSTVPVKFSLTDTNGNFVTNAVANIYISQISNNVIGTEIEANSTSSATEGNLFRYDLISNQYIFNLATKSLTAGTYQIRIELDDGTSKYVNIGLK